MVSSAYRKIAILSLPGTLLLVGIAYYCLWHGPGWLVENQPPQKTDAIVVLGGGGGSRLRRAVRLYDQKFSDLLILVGEEPDDWADILSRHCAECDLESRRHVILNGSVNTVTDARLVGDYLKGSPGVLMVVTDPYHTRRSDIIFKQVLRNFKIVTVSSGEYGDLLNPQEKWLSDYRTAKVVWLESWKVFSFSISNFFKDLW